MLLNIQSNALKYTERGFVRIDCQIIQENEAQFLEVSVVDSGVGIKEEDQEKLFHLFGFVDGTKNLNPNGIGLGLMISDMIVAKFNGSISFTSKENIGSTFTFRFKVQA